MKRIATLFVLSVALLASALAARQAEAQSPDDLVTLAMLKAAVRAVDGGFGGPDGACSDNSGSVEGCINSMPAGVRELCGSTVAYGVSAQHLEKLFCKLTQKIGGPACLGFTHDPTGAGSPDYIASCMVPRSVADPIWAARCKARGEVSLGNGYCGQP